MAQEGATVCFCSVLGKSVRCRRVGRCKLRVDLLRIVFNLDFCRYVYAIERAVGVLDWGGNTHSPVVRVNSLELTVFGLGPVIWKGVHFIVV